MKVSQFLKVICLVTVCALGASDVFAMTESNWWQNTERKPTKFKKTENHFFTQTESPEASQNVERKTEVKNTSKKSGSNDDETVKLSDLLNNLDLRDTKDEEVKNSQQVVMKGGLHKLLAAGEMGKKIPQHKILEKLDLKMVIEQRYRNHGFMIGDWTCYLTPDQVKEVVTMLEGEAKEFVGEKTADQKELNEFKARFKKLPENFFKMLVRKIYYKVYRALIDGVQTIRRNFFNREISIFDGFGGSSEVAWHDYGIQSLAMYSDVLMVWNSITPITSLDLGNNLIRRIEGLDGLVNLTTLYLSSNQITRIEGLDGLVNLSTLNLCRNQIARIEGLDRLVNLIALVLNNNHITEIEGLDRLVNLTELYLSFNHITKIEGLDELVNLSTLNLFHNDITIIEGLDRLINLTTLYLDGNKIARIEGLDRLVNLTALYLSHNLITRIEGLGGLVKLTTLWLYDNQIGEAEKAAVKERFPFAEV